MEQNVSTEKKSSEVIVVTSGKGGVGKTTTSANVGTGYGSGEPYRIQSGRCSGGKLPDQAGTDPGQETSRTLSDALGADQR